MTEIDEDINPASLAPALQRLWELSGPKVKRLCTAHSPDAGTPVHTVGGRYQPQGWTEWTEGFLYGWAILHYDATGDEESLELGRRLTRNRMAKHLTHTGVHDHGFNNVSTYGNLRRLVVEERLPMDDWELAFYEQALEVSGAVQASRWSRTADGGGYIYSFNGPHSLFCDTIRSVRSLLLGHRLGHVLMGENDRRISLLGRGIEHANATAEYSVYYGEDRDIYDTWGRVAHESTFNPNDGSYRAPSTQQGYSPFSTWTRGLAWVVTGFAELLEFLDTVSDEALEPYGGRDRIEATWLRAARASSDFFIEHTPSDGIPYWDTGAPGLAHLGDYLERPAEPDNAYEPVDSSAAATAAQGLLRLGRYLSDRGDPDGSRYTQAGLTVLRTLLSDAYLSTDTGHEGLLLHGLYHRPRGWDDDHGTGVPSGESVLWGDYHLVELALYAQRLIDDAPYYTFFAGGES